MHRSQGKKPAAGGSPADPKLKASRLEQAYGTGTTVKPTRTFKTNTKATGQAGQSSDKLKVSPTQKPKHSQSSIVAASKASYVEKYGPLNSKPTVVAAPTANSTRRKSSVTPTQGNPLAGSKIIAMSKNKAQQQQPATTRGKIATTSGPGGGSTQSQRAKNSKTVPKTKVEPEYDDDFEEDYQSDFEEVQSTDEEDDYDESAVMQQRRNSNASVDLPVESAPLEDEISYEELQNVSAVPPPESEDESEDDLEEHTNTMETQTIPKPKEMAGTSQGFFSKNPPLPATTPTTAEVDTVKTSKNLPSKKEEVKNQPSIVASSGRGLAKTLERQVRKEISSRAKHLLKMIKLDKVTGLVLNLKGGQELQYSSGPVRISQEVQTGSRVRDEGNQTDKVITKNMWSQRPVMWSTRNPSTDIRTIRMEALGVGTDDLSPSHHPDNTTENAYGELQKTVPVQNWNKISDFVTRASRKVLYVLESQKRLNISSKKSDVGRGNVAEIKMNRGLSVLNKLEMGSVFCDGDFLACSNGHSSDAKKHTSKNLITVWSMKEPSCPAYFLRVWGQVTDIHIDIRDHTIVAGDKDGSMSVWDLDEATHYHTPYQDHFIRTPTVITSCMTTRHTDRIVGLHVSHETEELSVILSLDKLGTLISWNCIRSKEEVSHPDFPVHTSPWSRLNLTVRTILNLAQKLDTTLFITSFIGWRENDGVIMFACGTVNGFATVGTLSEDGDINDNETEELEPKSLDLYEERPGTGLAAVCLSLSSYYDLLIIGYIDNKCRVFTLYKKKMALEISCDDVPIAVRWSPNRASVFYVATRNSISIWDLIGSDIIPAKIINVENIQGFTIYSALYNEFTIVLANNELKISSAAGDIVPLNPMDKERLESYIALICL